MKTLIETIKYEHKGIVVIAHVDHVNAKVSLVELDSNSIEPRVTDKQWKFAKRGLEFMRGWQDILDAMKYAVTEVTKLLEHDLAESSKFKEKIIREAVVEDVRMMKAARKFYGKKSPR